MRLLALSALLFAACSDPGKDPEDTGDGADTGDTAEPAGPAALEPGDVADMTATDAGVEIELANPGTYIVTLVSQAVMPGEVYGYGANAEAAARVEPGDPRPTVPHDDDPAPVSVAVGDTRTFEVWDGSDEVTVTAEATQVTDGVVFWVDTTTENPLSFDQSVLDDFLDQFQTIVIPRERQVFGEESDVDGDEKIHVLLSYTVNMYGAVAYVTSCDIGAANCTGNGGEIVYLGIPDPDSGYSSAGGIAETVAHELNHLIYGWHKYALNDQPGAQENIYLTEGMSALAQDLTGYNNGNQYVWAAALDAPQLGDEASIDSVSVNDFLRGTTYYDADRDGPLRGAAYLFLRYLFEQAGGMTVEADGTLVDAGGMAFLHDWFDAPELGGDTVPVTTGREVQDTILDWYTALVVTGRVENDNPAWNYQERVADPLTGYEFGVDPYATIHGWLRLDGPRVQPLDGADGEIRGGGVEYLEVEVTEAGVVSVPVSADARAVARILRVE